VPQIALARNQPNTLGDEALSFGIVCVIVQNARKIGQIATKGPGEKGQAAILSSGTMIARATDLLLVG
jgi:hypothetical protein